MSRVINHFYEFGSLRLDAINRLSRPNLAYFERSGIRARHKTSGSGGGLYGKLAS
jgi:hypothetical protein